MMADMVTGFFVATGRKGFASEEDARRVGNLVLERIRSGSDFTISASDLEQVTETNGFLYRAH